MLILVALSPLGLILPQHFLAGSAWGEWGVDEIKELVGYIPKGLEKLSTFWSAPLPDYTFKGWEDKPIGALSFAYIISAVLGVLLVVLIVLLLGKAIFKKDK